MLSTGTEEQLKCLECIECEGQFSIRSIRQGRFFVSTMTCAKCLEKLKASPVNVSCFGKPGEAGGYSPSDRECRLHCLDRTMCKVYAEEKRIMADATAIDDVDFSEVEEQVETKKASTKAAKSKKAAAGKTSKKAAVAEKPAKKTKTEKQPKKEVENDEPEPPKGCTDWPFRQKSILRYVFQICWEGGRTQAQIVKALAKAGFSDKQSGGTDFDSNFMIKCLKLGLSGKLPNPTHSWKMADEGNIIRPYDLKQLVKTGEKPAPKPKADKPVPVEEKPAKKAKEAAEKPATKKAKKTEESEKPEKAPKAA